MAEPRRDLRRAQIIAAARKLIAAGGQGALTINALEKELGFTRGVITYHFDNKDEIVLAVLDDAIAEIDRATIQSVKEQPRATDKVLAALRGMVRGFLSIEEAGRALLSFWSRLKEDPRAAEKNAALYARWRKTAADLIRYGQSAGQLGPCDADAMGALLVGIVIGVVTQAWFEDGAIDPEAVVTEAGLALLARLRPDTATR
ncbi:MAG: TetR/AcrR family transcriptional regulator [Deltaproteobacteria bacterium]|nr:TetR/AcrR family transcriptional regulator [Deltaproteobacteria bacterium]